MKQTHAVVLAAGKGTRMRSDLAKVLHPVAGRPMVAHVLASLAEVGVPDAVVVVGHQADAVREAVGPFGARCVLQEEQLGTGHAVAQAEPLLAGREGRTLVLCGDVPLLQPATLERLRDAVTPGGSAAAVLSAVAEDATGYGRILRDAGDHVVGIVEHKDATDEQRAIREYNTGSYCFRNDLLWPMLSRLGTDNAQGEFYLTDVVALLVGDGHHVAGVVCADERETRGVNTPNDLAAVERDHGELAP